MDSKRQTLSRINRLGVVAVLRGPSPETTLRMAAALVRGGVFGIEITYTTPQATTVVRTLAEQFVDQIVLGMGTLTRPEHARQAVEAGADFIVSPHGHPNLARAMVETGRVTMIGALTPSEVVQVQRWGSDVVKLFPGSLGGPGYLKALRGPYPDLQVMPTGGVTVETVADWFAAGAFAVGAGSALCPKSWAREGRFDDITARARTFVSAIRQARSKQ